jgi:DNA-binding NarL/FixJ family response regulator
MPLLPDLADLVIEQVSVTTAVTVTVYAASPTASCPCCGTPSRRVQSRYTRTLRDLPVSGRLVQVIVRVRRFFCHERTCPRKIFAERFPALTVPRAKFTLRLQATLRELGFALGGEAGARLGKQLSLPGSPDTLLRLVKGTPLPASPAPRVAGVDEWSWKRRLRYGTLICDLESGRPIAVLPDRSVETVAAWFAQHPTVEIVSRDRSAEFAAAIAQGAPQALQVADRWHLGKNLADSISTLLARCRAEIRRALAVQMLPEDERAALGAVPEAARPPRSRSVQRAQKLDRYTQVLELQQQGLSAGAIASRIGIGERTVYRWLAHGAFPEARPRRRRPSLMDPYERYVLQWWHEGNRKGSQLYQALTAQGYQGSPKALYNYLARLRTAPGRGSKSSPANSAKRKRLPSPPAPLENFSAQRATWLFVCQPEQLDQRQQAELALIRQASPSAETAYRLAQAFMQRLAGASGSTVGHLVE